MFHFSVSLFLFCVSVRVCLFIFFIFVLELPHNPPLIIGIRPRYHIGDILRGNCTSRHSKPAANLTWTVNNEEVSILKFVIATTSCYLSMHHHVAI